MRRDETNDLSQMNVWSPSIFDLDRKYKDSNVQKTVRSVCLEHAPWTEAREVGDVGKGRKFRGDKLCVLLTMQ